MILQPSSQLVFPPGGVSELAGPEGGGAAYANNIIATFGASIISYLKMDETSGATAADASGNSRTGGYNALDLANLDLPASVGGKAPLFGGVSGDYLNWYTASFAAAFNGPAGTLDILGQVPEAAWSDGVQRNVFHLRADASNRIYVAKTPTLNEFQFVYQAGGTLEAINTTALAGSTAWWRATMTWDVAAGVDGEMKAFLNGSQVGTTQTALGTWVGALASTLTLIGANSPTSSNWSGWLAHAFLLNRAATPAEIAATNF